MSNPSFTLQSARDVFYGILKEDEKSTVYTTTLADQFINKAQNTICHGTIVNIATKEGIKKPFLNFLSSRAYFVSVNSQFTSSNLTVGATTLDCTDTSNYLSSGYLRINGDIVAYAGKTATQFTGIPTTGDTSIQFPQVAGTRIFPLYALPTDYAQPTRLIYNMRFKARPVDQRDITDELFNIGYLQPYRTSTPLDYSDYVTQAIYSIIDGKYLLFIPSSDNGKMIDFEYQKGPAQLVNTTDLLTIPDEYSLTTAPYLSAGEILWNRGEEARGLEVWNIGCENVKMMYAFYNSNNKENIYNQRLRTSRDKSFYNL